MSTTSDPRGSLWHVAADDAGGPLLDELLARPDAVMARARVLKHDGTTTVAVAGDVGHEWVIKRYNTKNRWHAVRRLLRTSRAANCWHAADWLRQAGIDTARPVAVLEERRWRVLRGRSYFISHYIGGETLNAALDREPRAAWIEQASRIVRRLHASGIVHGDLKATNFVVSGERIHLLDLDATRRASGRGLENGRRRDLERFLRNWQQRPDLRRRFETALARPDLG